MRPGVTKQYELVRKTEISPFASHQLDSHQRPSRLQNGPVGLGLDDLPGHTPALSSLAMPKPLREASAQAPEVGAVGADP